MLVTMLGEMSFLLVFVRGGGEKGRGGGGGGGCKLYGCVGGRSSTVREQRGGRGKGVGCDYCLDRFVGIPVEYLGM